MTSTTTCRTRNARAALVVMAAMALFAREPVLAQSCSWGGSSAVAAPEATYLRADRDLLRAPVRVAVDAQGRVYTADAVRDAVVVRDSLGRLVGIKPGLREPVSLAVDASGRIYVGEREAGSVTVFDAQWNSSHRLGGGDGEFVIPGDIAVDPDAAEASVFVADVGAHEIRVYAADGSFRFSFGGEGAAAGRLRSPSAVHVSAAGEVWVGDADNDRLQVFDRTGAFLRCFGSNGSVSFSGKFGRISGITSDAMGRIYVADAFHGQVKAFDASGVYLATIGRFGSGPGGLRTPVGLAVDPGNRLLVASVNSGSVEVFGLDTFVDPHAHSAHVEVRPGTWIRDRRSRFATVLLEAPGFPLSSIDPASVAANGVAAFAVGPPGDADGDGIPDVTISFRSRTLLAALPDGDSVVAVTGELVDGNGFFEGLDNVTVLPGTPREGKRR